MIAGLSEDDLVEIVELPRQKHPWFLACQFHPEFTSTPRDGHPLFNGFVRAAREYKVVRDAPRLAAVAIPGTGSRPIHGRDDESTFG